MRTLTKTRSTALAAAAVSALAAVVIPAADHSATASARAVGHVTGGDVSWPQCPKGMGIPSRQGKGLPMPVRSARFVAIGVTNGPGFYPNPCLARQMRWVRSHHVYGSAYAMTTYPPARRIRQYGTSGPHTHAHRYGRLWNTGYAEAKFNVRTMRRVGLRSPIVWVDVEPYPVAPWSRSRLRNSAVVKGAVRGYWSSGYRVGFYSTPSMWRDIVGGLRYGFPEWHTAGERSRAAAFHTCSTGRFQGGRTVMGQWWTSRRDFDVMCPGYGRTAKMRTYFHKF